MNDKCKGRIVNWKFTQAMGYYEGGDDNERILLRSLSETFGDCGWFDGNMGEIVGAVVQWLLK